MVLSSTNKCKRRIFASCKKSASILMNNSLGVGPTKNATVEVVCQKQRNTKSKILLIPPPLQKVASGRNASQSEAYLALSFLSRRW